ncbi:ATP synthase F1 subunit delta [Candidatus Nomurabacteria bacterium]|nr:ATP synthase F1 subunit delta [Candidatus Nomurabacteria bacterium]
MSAISNNNIVEAIFLASKESKEDSQFFHKVVHFLAKKRLLSKSKDILQNLNKIINEAEGKVMVRVFSHKKLDENTRKEITHALSKRYGGKTIILEESLDEKLLGGYKIEVNDEVIDLTIKNKLEKLQEYLTIVS